MKSNSKDVPYIVDGLNVCMWNRHTASISILLSLLKELERKKLTYICIFDAVTSHRITDATERNIYRDLLAQSYKFTEVTGGLEADEVILLKAHSSGGFVISNDRFREFSDQYNWLEASHKRLIKGSIVGGNLLVPALNIDVPIFPVIGNRVVSLGEIDVEEPTLVRIRDNVNVEIDDLDKKVSAEINSEEKDPVVNRVEGKGMPELKRDTHRDRLHQPIQEEMEKDALEEQSELDTLLFWDSGLKCLERKDYYGAIRDFNKTIGFDSSWVSPYQERGKAYCMLGNHNRAIEDFNKAIEIKPEYDSLYYDRGVVYLQMDNEAQAIKDFSKAIELNPLFIEAYLNRAYAYEILGQTVKARNDRKKAEELINKQKSLNN